MIDNIAAVFGDSRRVNIIRLIMEMNSHGEPVYIRKLVQKTGYTAQTITNHINELEKNNVISKNRQEGSPTKYITMNSNVENVILSILGLEL